MNTTNQLILVFLFLIMTFFFFRVFFFGLKRFFFNNSAYKKRKKGQAFVEWLLYKRYWNWFPKSWLWIYYIGTMLHILVMVFCICMSLTNQECVGEIAARGIYYVDLVFYVIVLLLFWRPKDREFVYGRWIDKRKH